MNLTKRPPFQKGQKRKRQKVKSLRDHPASEFGTDEQFLDWLTYQPSALDGAWNQWENAVGRNIACHVRRAGNSGTAIKPPFSAIPMKDCQRRYQHQHGEAAVLERFYPAERESAPEQAKEWFDNQAKIHLMRWVQSVAGREAMRKAKQRMEDL